MKAMCRCKLLQVTMYLHSYGEHYRQTSLGIMPFVINQIKKISLKLTSRYMNYLMVFIFKHIHSKS